MITFDWRWIFCFILIFFLVFGLKVGAWLDSSNVVSLLIIAARFNRQAIDSRSLYFLGALSIMAVYTALIIFVNGAFYDIWHFFQIPRLILNGVAIYFLIAYMSNMAAGTLERALILGMVLHSLIIVAGMIIPELREAVYSISGFQSKSDLRFAGLTQSYGITSVVHAIGIFLILFSKQLGYGSTHKLLYVLVLFSAQLFLARIGLVFSCLFILLKWFTDVRLSKLPIAFLASACVVLGVYYMFDYFSPEAQAAIKHSLQLWFYFSEGREIESLETIQKFIFNNNSFFEYIFGTGHFGRGDQSTYLATDIAWAHMFSLGGLIYITGVLFVYFYPLMAGKSQYSFILVVVTLVILASNYKEAFVFTRSISAVWFFFVFLHFRALADKYYVR